MAVNLGEVFAEARMRTDKLHNDINEADSKISRFSHGLGTVIKAGAVAAGAALVGLGAAAVKTVNDLGRIEKIGAQTDAAIKSTGGAANVTRQEIDDLAGSLERMTSVEAESITEGQNLLLTFTQVQNRAGEGNDIFSQATKTMTDMSVALGQDMSQSAVQLGKALNDPIAGVTALRRVGVQLTEAQETSIKSFMEQGDIMSAQKVILEELNTQFGGSAEALGKTLPGQIQILKHEFGNLMETAVAPMLPAIGDITSSLTNMVKGFDTSVLQSAFASIGGIVQALMPIIGTIGEALLGVFAKVAPIISRVLERLAPLFDRILTAILPLVDPLLKIGEILVNAILDVVEAIMPAVEALVPIVTKILEFVAEVLEKIAPVLGEIMAALADILVQILERMEPYIDRLLEATMRVIDAILPILPEILDLMLPILELLLKLVDPLMAIMVKTQELYATVMEKIGALVGWLVEKLGGFVNWLTEWGTRLWGVFKAVWDKVVAVWHAVMDPLFEVIRVAWDTVSAYLGFVWDTIYTVASTVWNTIKDVIWTPIETVWGLITGAWDAISDYLSGLWNGLKDIAASIWNGIADGIKSGLRAVLRVAADALDAYANLPSVIPVPWKNEAGQAADKLRSFHTGGLIPGIEEQLSVVLGGEMVMNRQAVAANRDALISMNQGSGLRAGNSFDFRGSTFNLPGVTDAATFLDEVTREAERRSVILT